jgi:hypothetical protein
VVVGESATAAEAGEGENRPKGSRVVCAVNYVESEVGRCPLCFSWMMLGGW